LLVFGESLVYLNSINKKDAVKDLDLERLHPGAKKYFIEKGLLPK